MDEGRGFTIIDYEDRYKQALEDISLPWLLEYDLLEPVDLEMLAEPHRFLSGGGRVLLGPLGGGDCGHGSCWSFRGRASASCSSSV